MTIKLNNGSFDLGTDCQLEPANSSAALSFIHFRGTKFILQSFDGHTATWRSFEDDDETLVWEVSRSRA